MYTDDSYSLQLLAQGAANNNSRHSDVLERVEEIASKEKHGDTSEDEDEDVLNLFHRAVGIGTKTVDATKITQSVALEDNVRT